MCGHFAFKILKVKEIRGPKVILSLYGLDSLGFRVGCCNSQLSG